MPRNITNLNGTEGVAPGAISYTPIPTDRRYHLLKIYPAARNADNSGAVTSVVDMIDSIRLTVNGVLMLDETAEDLLAEAAIVGLDAPVGCLPIYFSEPTRASILGEEATSWDLAGQPGRSILEIKWKQAITVPSVIVKAVYDWSRNLTQAVNGATVAYLSIFKKLRQNWNFGAGVNIINNLAIDKPIQRLYFKPSAGEITHLEIIRDGEKIFEATPKENKHFLADYELNAEAFGAGSFAYVPDHEQQVSSALIATKGLEIRVTMSEPGSLRALVVQRVPSFA